VTAQPIVIDFETHAIEGRPKYPPEPVSVAIHRNGKSEWYAWGHPTKNNCARSTAGKVLGEIWKGNAPLLFHNSKFDLDVITTHFGFRMPQWDRVHDTLYILFLLFPYAPDFKLKPSSERLLGMKPEERDAIRDWLVAQKIIASNAGEDSVGANVSKAPADIVGRYAIGDVVRTLKLFEKFYPQLDREMRGAYDRERRLMPILLENERLGMRFDVERAERDVPLFEAAMARAEDWLRKKLKAKGLDFEKDRDVGEALAKSGIVTDFVMTKSGQRSVAKKNMGRDKFNDLEVFRVLGYRNRLQTVLSLNLRPWLAMAQGSGGQIFTSWSQTRREKDGGATTGRIACSRFMNVSKDYYDKNDGYEHPLSIEVPELPLVRRYLLPDKGQSFGHVDYSQQEFRIVAHYAGGAIEEEYRKNPRIDYHKMMQARIEQAFGLKLERRAAKIINFGILYGMGRGLLAAQLGVSVVEAGELLAAVRKAAPDIMSMNDELMEGASLERRLSEATKRNDRERNSIKEFKRGMKADRLAKEVADLKRRDAKLKIWDEETAQLAAALEAQGGHDLPIRTWGGRLYHCEPPRWVDKYDRLMTFEYKLLNYLVQGSAADCTKEAIIRYHEMDREARMLVTVHDEINISCPKGSERQEIRKLQDAMESIEFDVPMLTDAEWGPSWGELEALNEEAA
jgi:DNA polymerase I-like protein with 3'-5' exonuclease and polymerase domains